MSTTRSKDLSITQAPPRSERLYSNDELWYFRTREDDQVGPFRYRCEALSSLERYLNELKHKL